MDIDIYFNTNYGKLYEKIENGVCKEFKLECDYGIVRNIFIQREIPIASKYNDIVTPYGYGGPIVIADSINDRKQLINKYHEKFSQYCRDNNIVSEFVRFHPIINNVEGFDSIYKVENIRKTVGTNLKDYDDPVQSEFSKSCRKNIRRALKQGITYRVIESPNNISEFKKIYYSTMDRNKATDYYYFDDDYFENCLKYFKSNIILVEAIYDDKVIAAGLYFVYNKIIHIHLSGTLSEYLHLSPAYILRYAVTLWGKEKGYELIHHGGGRSNSPEDRLYRFKKQFGKNTEFDFYIGKKIWNMEIYKKLCQNAGVDDSVEFFPAYRWN